MVILGFLLVLTAIQYVSQQFKFNSFVKYWKSQDDVQQWGLEATKEEYQEKLKSAKKLSKQEKRLLKAELVDKFLTMKSKELDVKGGYKKLVWHELIIVQFLICPYTIPRRCYHFFAYILRVIRNTPTEEDKRFWTRCALKMKSLQWEQLDDEEKADFVSRKLWISANLSQYQKEKQEEYLRSNPNQMKRYLRWKKNNGKVLACLSAENTYFFLHVLCVMWVHAM